MADLSTPIHERTFDAVVANAYSALSAADAVMAGSHSAYALCRPPGHHASTESAGGFCFINNAAVAAAHLRHALNEKIGILDIDVHHGNGTQIIFYERADVITTSVHADPSRLVPFYAGYADETGAGAGQDCNLNIPLPHGSGDAPYLSAIEQSIGFCERHGVKALVVALGLDAYEEDPIGAMKVTTAGFYAAGLRIGQIPLPIVLVQEGGYLNDKLGVNLCAFLSGFEKGRGL